MTDVPIDLQSREQVPAASAGSASRRLIGRLIGRDLDDLRRSVTEDFLEDGRAPELLLAIAVHRGIASVLEKTGLRADEPPEDVHAMARGPLASGGSYWYADRVADALQTVGAPFTAGQNVLDFGCSSGRVVRVLAAAWPDVSWRGCDPNEGAIAWAREHLGDLADFRVSPTQPPLDIAPDTFDVVYAISIWSHFATSAAAHWLAEMHRVIRPGGHLVFTTHGWHTLSHESRRGIFTREHLEAAAHDLYASGAHWFDSFGREGDWGVKHPEWGFAMYTADWILSTALPGWQASLFRPGVIEDNQDLWVLRANKTPRQRSLSERAVRVYADEGASGLIRRAVARVRARSGRDRIGHRAVGARG